MFDKFRECDIILIKGEAWLGEAWLGEAGRGKETVSKLKTLIRLIP